MASPQRNYEPPREPVEESQRGQRNGSGGPSGDLSGDLGLKRVEREVGKGRAFAWWWVFVVVVLAAIVWWAGWGRTTRTAAPASHRTLPAASAPAGRPAGSGTARASQPQAASKPG
jgi:hypothetical protein